MRRRLARLLCAVGGPRRASGPLTGRCRRLVSSRAGSGVGAGPGPGEGGASSAGFEPAALRGRGLQAQPCPGACGGAVAPIDVQLLLCSGARLRRSRGRGSGRRERGSNPRRFAARVCKRSRAQVPVAGLLRRAVFSGGSPGAPSEEPGPGAARAGVEPATVRSPGSKAAPLPGTRAEPLRHAVPAFFCCFFSGRGGVACPSLRGANRYPGHTGD